MYLSPDMQLTLTLNNLRMRSTKNMILWKGEKYHKERKGLSKTNILPFEIENEGRYM